MGTASANSVLSNSDMKIRLFVILLFIIYPLGALPFILIEIYNRKRYAFHLLAIFIGFVHLLFPPIGDLYRYAQDYFELYNVDFNTYLQFTQKKMDYGFSLIMWLYGQLGLSVDLLRFLYGWIGSELVLSVFYGFTANSRWNKKNVFLLFCIFFLYVEFNRLMYRYGLSTALFVYGTYLILYKQKRSGWCAVFLSIFNHFSLIVFAIALVVHKIMGWKGNRTFAIMCIIGIFLLSTDVISDIIHILPVGADVMDHLLAYTEGKWSGEFLEEYSFRFYLMFLFKRVGIVSLYIIYIIMFRKDKWSGWLNVLIIPILLGAFSVMIRTRFEITALYFFLFYIIYRLQQYPPSSLMVKRVVRTMLFIGVFLSVTYVYSSRREYSLSQESKLLYSSSYSIVTTTFDKAWIREHVFSDGSL